MDNEDSLRNHLVSLLNSAQAHAAFDDVVVDWPVRLRGVKPSGLPYTAWQLIEHLRIAQWDILEFSRDPDHVSPDFPSGYWPQTDGPPDATAWENSLAGFRADLKQMCNMVSDASVDLFAPIPHGSGQTILREALLVADHNAYHLGELVVLRRLLGAWQTR